MHKTSYIHLAIWAFILAIFWLLLSGFLKPLLLGFGVISVALVMILLKRMDSADGEQQTLTFNFSFLRYLVWLLGQITLSSLEVTKLVWGGNQKLSPATAKLPVDSVPQTGRVLYANSITLTPGTLSIDIDENHVTVHALHKDSIVSLEQGEMANKVQTGVGGEK
jgi:multicomponent Na+:H+ antiporter subunit E